jgi:curved DNA-binding protein CbpA
MSDIKMSGTLAQTPVAEIFLWVFERKFTGALVLAKEGVKKSIFFEKGKPISARSNVVEEGLGTILLEEKKLTQAQLQKSLLMKQGGESAKIGQALLSMKLIDAAGLGDALHRQFLKRTCEVFHWADGKYALVTDMPGEVTRVDIPEPLPAICLKGLTEKYKKSPELSKLNGNLKPTISTDPAVKLEDLKLVAKEAGLLKNVNGSVSLGSLIPKVGDETHFKAFILALRDLGVIQWSNETVLHGTSKVESTTGQTTGAVKTSNEFMADLVKKMEAARKQNFFEILGVQRNATDLQIKEAYFNLAKTVHPDRLPTSISLEEKRIGEAYFAMVTEAHATVGNSRTRKEYEANLEVESTGVETDQVNEIIQSEMEFQKGRILIKKGDFPQAIEFLARAVQLYSKEPEYFAYLGWAQYRCGKLKQDVGLTRKGKDHLAQAIKEKPNFADSYFFSGLIEKQDGDMEKAKRMFQKTIDLVPNHAEANSELRIINMRETKKPSGLMGVFGKKKK